MSARKAARARGLLFAAAFAAATPTSLFGAAHLRLVNEGASGPLYECDAMKCEPARTDNPSRKNRASMDFYVLPEGCVELRSAVLRPDGPGIDVECAAPGIARTYRCEAGACNPLDSAAGDDGATTWPITLPADCGGRIHELIVLYARSDAPKAYIECDASTGSAGGM